MTQQSYQAQLGAWIRGERAALGLKQETVALDLGVSDGTFSRWERGEASMTSYTEWRVRDYFRRKRVETKVQA